MPLILPRWKFQLQRGAQACCTVKREGDGAEELLIAL